MKHLLPKLKNLGALPALITLLLLPGLGWGQTTINFDDAAKWTAGSAAITSYASDHTYVDGVFSATGGPALRNTTAAQDGFPGALGTYAWRLTNAAADWRITIASGGVSTFSIDLRRWDSSPSPAYNLEYSTDGGTNWTLVSAINNTTLDNSSAWKTFNGTINNANTNILIRLVATGTTERIHVDNFVWTGYSSGNPTAATPTFTPPAGTYYSAQDVEIACATSGSTIYYTTDGSDPDETDTEYTGAISVSSTITIKAIAYASGYDPSAIASATYTIPVAQTTTIPYVQNFGTDLGDCYSFTVSGTKPWYWGTESANANGFNGSNPEEQWLVLPGINFGNYTGERMSFTTYVRFGTVDANNYLKLFYSTDYAGVGNPTGSTWTEISFAQPATGTVGSTEISASSGVLDLSTISGTSVFLAFKYYSTDAPSQWRVDDINIYQATPIITVTPTTLSGFTYEYLNGPSDEQTFTVSGADLQTDVSLSAVPTNYEISKTTGTGFTTSLTFTPAEVATLQTVYVRLKSGLAIGDYNDEVVTASSTNATSQTVTCSGSVTAPPPPAAPVATAATGLTAAGFTANWEAATGASGYKLDVYTKSVTPVGGLFISEYIEGSSSNKAIEIYNGTGSTFDLTGYNLKVYANGSTTPGSAINLSGTLANGATYIVANPSANATILSLANMTSGSLTHNGNDAVGLFNGTTLVDVVGPIGDNSDWGINVTLVRKPTATVPSTTYSASDWNSYATDVTTYLGSHTFFSITYVTGYEDLSVSGTSQAVSGLSGGTTYYYVVRAVNDYGTSANSNEISVTTPLPVYTLLGAEDAAANYSSWANNDNEGCGFEAWTLTANGSGGSYLGGTGLGASTFGIYSGGDGSNNFFIAKRDFIDNMPVGSTFQVSLGYTGVSTGGSIGISLFSNNNFRLTFKFVGGNSFWVVNDGGSDFATTIPWDDNAPLSFAFTRGSGNNYSLAITQGAVTYTADDYTSTTGTMDIDRIEIFTSGQGGGQNLGFDALAITSNPSVIPAASSVFVKGCVELAEDLEVEDLTIEAGNTLQVDAGFDLTVNGTFDNQSDASALVLKSDASATASLIHSTADVPATVERYITAATWETAGSGWHLLSSPVAAQSISGDWTPTGAGNDYDFYAFDETATTEYWLNQKVGANNITAFIPGKGYLVAYQQTDTKTFSGNLNVADVTLSGLTNTGTSAYPGWHLAGNPFASAINWGSGTWTKTNINAVAQVWSSADGSYKTTTEQSDIIPAMNGFMVYTTGSGELTIPADAREHNAANWYKSDEEFILLKANDLEGLTSQSSIVRFNPSATEAYDADFDAYFLAGFAPMFYSVSGSSLYALNTLPAISNELAIPFGFMKNSATNYSIELAKNIPATIVYLTDIKTGTVTNLTEDGAYHFTAAEGDDANRFTLHFGTLGMDDPSTAAPVNIYAYGGVVYLNGPDAKASVTITDLTGRVVMAERVNGNGLSMLNAAKLPKGVYVVTAVAGSRVVSAKVIL